MLAEPEAFKAEVDRRRRQLFPASGALAIQSYALAAKPSPAAAPRAGIGVKRQLEFAAGRACARAACAALGIDGAPIPVGAGREPVWPAGLVGSITHSGGVAAAVVARQTDTVAIGIDIERADAVGPDIWREIFTERETAWQHDQPEARRSRLATVVFCAKEAFYKFQYPVTRAWLEFRDVDASVNGVEGTFLLRCESATVAAKFGRETFAGRFLDAHGFVLATLHLAAPGTA